MHYSKNITGVKALSIKQPWAWGILNCGKDIENRKWHTNIRGQVLIHTGKKVDSEAYSFLSEKMGLNIPSNLPLGGIVGSVEISDCVTESNSDWFFGPYGFVLRNPISLPFIPCRGRLGFFYPDNNHAA